MSFVLLNVMEDSKEISTPFPRRTRFNCQNNYRSQSHFSIDLRSLGKRIMMVFNSVCLKETICHHLIYKALQAPA